MALLLRDARTEVIQCIKEGQAEIPNGDKTGAAKTSVSGPGQNAPSQSESQVESDIPRPNAGNGDSGRADVKELMVLVRKALREARIGYRGLGVSGNTVRVEISQKTPDTIADARARLQRLADLFNSEREGDKVVVTVAGGKFELSLATR